jgi:hypothetical protein
MKEYTNRKEGREEGRGGRKDGKMEVPGQLTFPSPQHLTLVDQVRADNNTARPMDIELVDVNHGRDLELFRSFDGNC